MKKQFLIVVGTPCDGVQYFGPFDDWALASEHADINFKGIDFWISQLNIPNDEIEEEKVIQIKEPEMKKYKAVRSELYETVINARSLEEAKKIANEYTLSDYENNTDDWREVIEIDEIHQNKNHLYKQVVVGIAND